MSFRDVSEAALRRSATISAQPAIPTGRKDVIMNQQPEARRLRDESVAEAVDIEPAAGERFEVLADWWEEETFFHSNSSLKNAHPALQEIISMGEPIVPLILERMRSQGGHWFEALQQITGADPVSPADYGKIAAMQNSWLQWGEDRGYI